jgi:two-component sensor histidine kinase
MASLLYNLIRTGTGGNKAPWEDQLIMRINRITLLGALNMLIGIVFFSAFNYPQYLPECIGSIAIFSIVLLLNKIGKYMGAVYMFYIGGYIFLMVFSLRLGQQSYMILFFFPVIISMVQFLGRSETMKHLIILSALCVLSISGVSIGYHFGWLAPHLAQSDYSLLSVFNIILSFITTILFTLLVVRDFLQQEAMINEMLNDKDVLLAEVFHRVKNNLNVVTSILNLQKNSSSSKEVQDALEECRNRVYSMALVHENLFNRDKIGLDFKEYIDRLVRDIEYSFGVNGETTLELDTENVIVDLDKAVPCGMILNELITNAHKYARIEGKTLHISITLKRKEDKVELIVKDNGPGIPLKNLKDMQTLGFILIESLSEQLGGKCLKTNDHGFVYQIVF